MKRLETMLVFLALAATSVGADFNVRAFGAVGDGATKDTAAVQRALDACAQAGGGRVTVPMGTYLIGSVYLGNRTELHLQKGATLLGSPNLADYNAPDAYPQNFGSKNEGWSAKHLILALEKQGVSITGQGTIDGNGRAFFDDKPQFVGKICWHDAEDKALRCDGLGVFRVQSADDVSFANCTFLLNGAPVTDPRHIFSTQDAALPTLK